MPWKEPIELYSQPALTRCYPRKSLSKRAPPELNPHYTLSKPTPIWQCDPLHAADAVHAMSISHIQPQKAHVSYNWQHRWKAQASSPILTKFLEVRVGISLSLLIYWMCGKG
jgi:hypothetical protein